MAHCAGPEHRDCRVVWSREQPDLELVRRVVVESFELHDVSSPQVIRGPAGYRRYVAAVRSALPDLRARVVTALRARDGVFYRRILVGTHRRQFVGVPASGETVRLHLSTFARTEEGRLCEAWTPGWQSLSRQLADASDGEPLPPPPEDDPTEWGELDPDREASD